MKKLLSILIYLTLIFVIIAPLLLFFLISWYYALIIGNIFYSIYCFFIKIISNKEYSPLKSIIIPLIFNFFGFCYIILKIYEAKDKSSNEPDENLSYSPKSKGEIIQESSVKSIDDLNLDPQTRKKLEESMVTVDMNKEKDIVFLHSHTLSIQLLDFNNDNLSKKFLENHIASQDDIKHHDNLANMHEDFLVEKFPDIGIMELDFFDIDELSKISFDELTWNKCIKDCSFSEFYGSIVYKNSHSESFDFLINVLTNSHRVNFLDKEFNSIPNNSLKNILEANIKQSYPIFLHMIYYDESVDHG